MKKILQIGATTCIVGFGIWFALFFAGAVCTMFGEGNPGLFQTLWIFSIAAGVVTALFWASRRIRGIPVRIPEWILLLVAFLSLSGLTQHIISEEAHDFLAFNPRVAAQVAVQRYAPIKPGDTLTFTFLGTTSMGGRVYSVERDGKLWWVVGVFPRYRLWWILGNCMPWKTMKSWNSRVSLKSTKIESFPMPEHEGGTLITAKAQVAYLFEGFSGIGGVTKCGPGTPP